MVKIFLRSVKRDIGNGIENCLAMRDSYGNEGINELETRVPGGSKVKWELEKESGIQDIKRIFVEEKQPKGKAFKYEPKRIPLKKVFKVDVVVTDIEILEKYNIKYKLDDGTEVTIDPFIRIPPRI